MALYDTGHRDERFVSARAVLKDEVAPDKLDGHDRVHRHQRDRARRTCAARRCDDAVPGVEVHAQLAEQMLEHRNSSPGPTLPTARSSSIWRRSARCSSSCCRGCRPARMAIVAAVFIGIGLIVPWLAFSEYDLLFDPIYPPVTLAVIYVSGTALAFMRTERERAAIRGAFGLYLSPDRSSRWRAIPSCCSSAARCARSP